MKQVMKNGFLFLVAFCFLSAVAYAADPADVMSFKAKKGTVTFKHKAHLDKPSVKEKGCKSCHHKMEGDKVTKKCRDCHTAKKEDKRPELKKAMHDTCKTCHKKDAAKKAPTKCNDCHAKAAK